MMTRTPALAALPSFTAERFDRATSVAKGLLAYATCRNFGKAEEQVKDDRRAVALLQRSATTVAASTTVTALNESTVDTTIDVLGPMNAAGAVFSHGAVKVVFDREASVWVPGVAADASKVGFCGKTNPLRNVKWDTSKGCTLTAGLKLGFSISMTNEMLVRSNAVSFLKQKMMEDIGAGLDALLFDNVAAVVGERPAGLLASAQTVTASDSSVPRDALVADLSGLAAKVGPIGGEIIYVCNVQEQTKIQARLPLFKNVYASGAIAAGGLIAIAPRGVAIAGSDTGPRIDTDDVAVVQLDDALTNQQFSNSNGTVNFPISSLWQQDCSSIRLILPDLCWGQRVAAGTGGCVAALTGSIKW
jgi:hypothetical protein